MRQYAWCLCSLNPKRLKWNWYKTWPLVVVPKKDGEIYILMSFRICTRHWNWSRETQLAVIVILCRHALIRRWNKLHDQSLNTCHMLKESAMPSCEDLSENRSQSKVWLCITVGLSGCAVRAVSCGQVYVRSNVLGQLFNVCGSATGSASWNSRWPHLGIVRQDGFWLKFFLDAIDRKLIGLRDPLPLVSSYFLPNELVSTQFQAHEHPCSQLPSHWRCS